MRIRVINMVIAAIAFGVLLWVVLAPPPGVDWVLFNGKVFTSNAKQQEGKDALTTVSASLWFRT